MMKSVLVVIVMGACCCLWPDRAQAMGAETGGNPAEQSFTIGVVRDGPCLYFDDLTERVQHELEVLTRGEFHVVFKAPPSFSADWNIEKVAPALESALGDPSVDLVFIAGIMAAHLAGSEALSLQKPVVSGFIQDPDTQGLPYDATGLSTKTNFNFVVELLRPSRDLDVFYDMVSFTNLGIAVDGFLMEGIGDEVEREVEVLKKRTGCEVTLLPLDTSAEEFLREIPPAVDSIYLTPALRMEKGEWQRVIDGLNERGLPTFSLLGHQDVDAGVLAGLQPECRDRLARRIALNIQQIMSAEIGYTPSFDILVQADILHLTALQQGKQLNLKQAVLFALENNIELARKEADVRGSEANRGRAMSVLLPQINGGMQYAQADNKTAAASMGTIAEEQTKAGIAVTQLLLSDPAIAQYRAAREIHLAGLDNQESTRLDVMQTTANTYIQLLQTRAIYRIEMNNLRLTRRNLDLARVRHEVGTAGPEEVYRWEAEAASGQADAYTMESNVETMQIELNRIMGAALQARWAAQEIEPRTNSYYFLDGRLDGIIDNDIRFGLLQDFILGFAIRNSSALDQMDRYIQAARLELNQYKRRFVMPEISASFNYNHTLDNQYAAEPPAVSPDDEWVAGIQLELPLFKSGGRVFDVARAQAALDQLQEQRKQVERLVEQQVRGALISISSSFPNIALQKQSFEFSEKNLAVVKDKYARGAVSILDLLDAQNQAFTASRRAEIARYTYLEDLINLQRAMCWFELDKTEAEKDRWLNELQAYIEVRDTP